MSENTVITAITVVGGGLVTALGAWIKNVSTDAAEIRKELRKEVKELRDELERVRRERDERGEVIEEMQREMDKIKAECDNCLRDLAKLRGDGK